jgi:hypothetical protein
MSTTQVNPAKILFVIKKHYSTDDLEMKPPLITNMMQRKDISKYIYKPTIQNGNSLNLCI